jgi:predicted nucleic-acid-binding Zn-ribbon protein
MPFDPSRFPDALTIGRLLEMGLPLAVHCHRCGRCELFAAGAFSLPLTTDVPALGRFRCSRCGSRSTGHGEWLP